MTLNNSQSERKGRLVNSRVTTHAVSWITAVSVTVHGVCNAQTASLNPPPAPPAVVAASIPGNANSISRIASGSETLHIVVGHSMFLSTRLRLRRVYVADPSVLNSITLTPNQIIVTATAPGISSLVLLDESGQAQSYVISSDLDVQGLRTAISAAIQSDTVNSVNVEGNGDRVLLSGRIGSEALAATAVKLASLYSKDVANSLTVVPEHPKQVRLKVRILEVDRSKLNQLGINLFNPGGNTSFLASTTTSQFPSTSSLNGGSSGNTSYGTLTTSNPLNFFLYSSKLNLGATVQDLENKNILQILAEPTITTVSGQKANFLSGGEFPFPVIQPGGGSGTSSSVTIQFRPYGVKLEFTPLVNDDGTIRLKVAPEVSALDYTNAVNISGYTIPALSTRKAETEVELRNNQSFAISGLLDQRTTDLFSKTPGAANIPIIGALFKSKNITRSTTELVVIITPTLVDPLTETVEPTQPSLPIPPLNTGTFDQSLGKNKNPNPTAPPLAQSEPTTTEQVPSPVLASGSSAALASDVSSEPSPVTSSRQLPGDPPPAELPPSPAAFFGPATAGELLGQRQPPVFESMPTQPSMRSDNTAPATSPSAVSAQKSQETITTEPSDGHAPPLPRSVSSASAIPTMVQIMALSTKEDADAMVVALKRLGYEVKTSRNSKATRIQLEIGPFKNTTEAEAVRQKLLTDGYNATVK